MHSYNTDALRKRFIVIEGIDGAGTTTQMHLLVDTLRTKGYSCVATAEPTRQPIGVLLRSVLSGEYEVAPSTVAYLFAADRNDHIFGSNGIAETTHGGTVVISDRYALSSLAYQGVTCGPELPWQLNSQFPAPGLTLLFKIDPSIALQRIDNREKKEIYETLEFQKRVEEMYFSMADRLRNLGWNIIAINATKSISEVQEAIESQVLAFLSSSKTE